MIERTETTKRPTETDAEYRARMDAYFKRVQDNEAKLLKAREAHEKRMGR